LVNLLLRDTSHRIELLDVEQTEGIDPEIHVVTRFDWRTPPYDNPILVEIPSLLSILEALRGARSVPSEIYLDSTEGLIAHLSTGVTASQVPRNSKDAVRFLLNLCKNTVWHTRDTIYAVEDFFWKAARQRGYSPEIVRKIALKDDGYDRLEVQKGFADLLKRYFSIRFRIHRAESCLMVEGRV
jgi:hypothetical protein